MGKTIEFISVDGGSPKFRNSDYKSGFVVPSHKPDLAVTNNHTLRFNEGRHEFFIDIETDIVIFNDTTYAANTLDVEYLADLINVFFISAGLSSADGGGAVVTNYREISSTNIIKADDYTINCIAGTFNLTAISPVGIRGQGFEIINSGSGTVTLLPSAGNIMGQSSIIIPPGHSVTIKSTGANYIITSSY